MAEYDLVQGRVTGKGSHKRAIAVRSNNFNVDVRAYRNGRGTAVWRAELTADEARELAAHLLKHADRLSLAAGPEFR